MAERVGRALAFTVTGAFVTRISREWYWEEHRPWEKVEELLLSCMCGTSQTKEELKAHARDVVFGRAKFVGNTEDGSYALVEDDQDLVIRNVDRLVRKFKKVEASYNELAEQHTNLVDRIEEEGYEWLLTPSPEQTSSTASPLLRSFLDEAKIEREHDDNYGWLEPDGAFHPVDWGHHDGWAADVIKARGWMGEYAQSDFGGLYGRGDFLVEAKGWVLIHNPGLGVAQVTKSDTRPLTKAQREFLFDYYTDRGKDEIARKYLEEE